MRRLWPYKFKQLEMNQMSKKLLVVMLSFVGAFALAACEKKSEPATEAPAAVTPAAPATEAPAAPATEEPAGTPPAIDKK